MTKVKLFGLRSLTKVDNVPLFNNKLASVLYRESKSVVKRFVAGVPGAEVVFGLPPGTLVVSIVVVFCVVAEAVLSKFTISTILVTEFLKILFWLPKYNNKEVHKLFDKLDILTNYFEFLMSG